MYENIISTLALQKRYKTKKNGRFFSAAFSLLFKLKHGAGLLCPAVLCHVFTVKFGLAALKIADIIALYEARVHAVARCLVAQDRLRSNRSQRILQIHKELAQIRRVLGIVGIVGKENGAYLLCRHSRTLSVYEESKELLGFQSLEHQLLVLCVNLEITEAIYPQELFPFAHALDIVDLCLHVLCGNRLH